MMMLGLKAMHILGACMFIGNILVSAVWKVMADRTGDLTVVRYATRLVNLTDLLFTATGVGLLLVSGHLLAARFGGVFAMAPVRWSYALVGASGLLWLVVLLPLQWRQAHILGRACGPGLPDGYAGLARAWSVVGAMASLLPLPAIILMAR